MVGLYSVKMQILGSLVTGNGKPYFTVDYQIVSWGIQLPAAKFGHIDKRNHIQEC
jgi:hypothetical protein